MAVFGTEVDRPLYGRGPSPGLRFTGYAVLAVVLMYYDRHGHWEQRLRYALQAATYPVQVVVNSPSAGWRALKENFQSREQLRAENERLRAHERELELMRCLVDLPHVVAEAASDRAPHKVTNWVRMLAGEFHGFYHDCRVLSDEVPPELTQARLWLVEGVRVGLAIALNLLGVRAPEAM